MQTYKIAVIAGDGIGPEVLAEGIKVLERAAELDGGFRFEFTHFPWGCRYYLEHGTMMPKDGIRQFSDFDAIYLGAVGYPGVPDHISLWDLLLTIRHEFDQYVNLRPVKLLKGAPCPLKDVAREDIDMLVIRENSEGEYAGEGNWLFRGEPDSQEILDLIAVAKETTGEDIRVCGSCLSDLSVIFKYGKAVSFAFGAGRDFSDPGGAHQANEYIECDRLLSYAKIIAGYILRVLG